MLLEVIDITWCKYSSKYVFLWLQYKAAPSNIWIQLFVHNLQPLVQVGSVVTVEGGIMHKPKASALSARDRYYIAQVH